MRFRLRARFLVFVACAGTAAALGCAEAPPCNVSPVEIEELREDIAVVEKDLAGVQERVRRLTEDLAAKQADLEAKKPVPDSLRQRLEQLKRGSGRTEKQKAGEARTPANKKESS